MSGGWVTKAHQGALPNPAERFGQIEALSLQALKEMQVFLKRAQKLRHEL
jgi:hypothetical protein